MTAYYFTNNDSGDITPVTINTGVIPLLPNNIALGFEYTVSVPDYTESARTNKMKLTDGLHANKAESGLTAWEGFHDNYQTLKQENSLNLIYRPMNHH